MFSTATELRPTFPVSLAPARIGIGVPAALRPMVRLKNGTRLLALLAGGPIWKAPWFSRKNSRFSGKNRLKRVRLICCASVSTCEKSVRHDASSTRLVPMPTFTSSPPSAERSSAPGVCRHSPVVKGLMRMLRPGFTPWMPSSTPANDVLNWLNWRGVGFQMVCSLV